MTNWTLQRQEEICTLVGMLRESKTGMPLFITAFLYLFISST
jgi:hypothetical protein